MLIAVNVIEYERIVMTVGPKHIIHIILVAGNDPKYFFVKMLACP